MSHQSIPAGGFCCCFSCAPTEGLLIFALHPGLSLAVFQCSWGCRMSLALLHMGLHESVFADHTR